MSPAQAGLEVPSQALCSAANDITIVDTDTARLKLPPDRLDLRTVVGNAAHPAVLTDIQSWVCTLAMLLGRVGILSLLILFTPAFRRQ